MRDSATVDRTGQGHLTVIGDLVEDVVVWIAAPTNVGTDNPSVVHRSRGGSAANVAALAAADVPTRFIGRIGTDRLGDLLADELRAAGVEVLVQREGRTGTVVVLVDVDGERTMFPDRAASAELSSIDPSWLAGTDVVHVPAYGLARDSHAAPVLAAVAAVRAAGGSLSVDVSATTLVDDYGLAEFLDLLDGLRPEYVFANGDETSLLGLLDRRPWPGCAFVVKNGPLPAVVVHPDGRHTVVEAVTVDRVLDTTGAGDAFAAGFLASRIGGAPLEAACVAGHRRAAAILATPGAGSGHPRELG